MLFAVSSEGGISRIAGHDMSTLSFGGQLPEEALGLWDTPSGLRVLTMPRYGLQVASAWRLLEGAWTPQRLCPETYDDRRSYPGQVVHGGSPVASDTTGTFAVCAEPPLSHTERLLRSIRSGEWDTIAEWTETLSHGLLPAPDGSWLSADPLGGVLKRLVGRGWEAGGVAPAEEFTGFMRRSLPEFVVVWQSAPNRAIYHATKQGRLLELTRRPDGRWRLERMNRSAISSVWDAARDGDDAILVASPRGLFRYLPGSSVLTRLPSPPSDRIVSITRDTSGRLWAVGDHVHVSADEGRSWLAVEVPADSTAEATLVRPYPGAAGAVVVMTSSRGVVVIAP
jgi:hypothetical protein